MAISEIWLPRPAGSARVLHSVGEQVQRTLPFAWVPVAVGLGLVLPVVASFDGTAQWAVVGGLAIGVVLAQLTSLVAWSGSETLAVSRSHERTTDDVLRPLRRSGWKVLRDVSVGGRTVDHLAIGPGGVLVVETKVRSHLTADDLAWATGQVQRSRLAVHAILTGDGSGPPVPVVPVVVTWGTHPDDVEPPAYVDGVRVVRGEQLGEWLEIFQTPRLTSTQVDAAWARIWARSVAGADAAA